MSDARRQALFVLGAPRSGTSLIGRFLGSHPACRDLGEYYAFYLALDRAPGLMPQSTVRHEFVERLADFAESFADESCKSAGKRFWCDQTPMNLEVAETLAKRLPTATFVLVLRHYRGAVLSLRNLFAEGYTWAGRQIEDSAKLWARYYAHAPVLPPDRTIIVSYDRLCESPEEEVSRTEREVAAHLGIEAGAFDRLTLTKSRSTRKGAPTMAEAVGDEVRFRSIDAYDSEKWNEGTEAVCDQFVRDVDAALRERYGVRYAGSQPVVRRP